MDCVPGAPGTVPTLCSHKTGGRCSRNLTFRSPCAPPNHLASSSLAPVYRRGKRSSEKLNKPLEVTALRSKRGPKVWTYALRDRVPWK